MKKRLKIIITSSMLVFSLALMAFGVYAATNHTLGVENYISFDIEDNIAVNIVGKTAMGSSALAFDSAPSIKTISVEAGVGDNTLTATEGTLENGIWIPWTKQNPALLDVDKDTVYWIFKVQNTGALGANTIGVSVTNNENTTLTALTGYNLTVLYGTSGTELPNQVSLSLQPQEIGYVLIYLKVNSNIQNIPVNTDPWIFKINIKKIDNQQQVAYLRKDFRLTEFTSEANELIPTFDPRTITLTTEVSGGDGQEYSGNGIEAWTSLGASDINGTTALTEETELVKDIKGYLEISSNEWKFIIHSPGKIYAPVDSTLLFSGLKTVDFENFDEEADEYLYDFSWTPEHPFGIEDILLNNNIMNAAIAISHSAYLKLDNLDTSYTTNMKGMFLASPFLYELNLNTSKVQDTSFMFAYTGFITTSIYNINNFINLLNNISIDFENFDLSNVINMKAMFAYSIAPTLNMESMNTSNVVDMSFMFFACMFKNNGIDFGRDLSGFDTRKVINMSYMFAATEGVDSDFTINLDSLNTLNVTNMRAMFSRCEFRTLDLSNFDTRKVINFQDMFGGSTSMVSLNISSFYVDKNSNTEDMLNFESYKYGGSSILQTLVTPNYVGQELYVHASRDIYEEDLRRVIIPANTPSYTITIE